ncbi:GNAT family N-acetyltransferase [Paraglaciecola polaris]|uniref:Acetyltransferase, gnat family n=1 Tax=Paraglaciecola polaris LMG 21857 TaxID=1129793 RepID=K6ZWT9_9ALTE|nr:GNAT family N-acetyltransferase [Paraglaciecola polaris]GAC33258.1 acetyltransferase, gnat family [Paraglaciecola polaris LMG 21857]
MKIEFRQAKKQDIDRCIEVRGLTSDNQFTKNDLAAIGVTAVSWSPLIENSEIVGSVALDKNIIVGFCFGESVTGEILVLAVLSGYERFGIGKELLSSASKQLFTMGHKELYLAASATPVVRSYGFYRRVGWQPTNTYNDDGDEILTLNKYAT